MMRWLPKYKDLKIEEMILAVRAPHSMASLFIFLLKTSTPKE